MAIRWIQSAGFTLSRLLLPLCEWAFEKDDESAAMKAIRDWMNEQGVKNPVGEALTYNSLLCPFNPRLVLGVGVGVHQGGRRGVLGVPPGPT